MNYAKRLCLLLVPLAALLAVASAAGSPPTPVSGTFTTTSSTFNSVRVAGNNLIVELSGTVSYTGTFSGTSTINGTLIIHLDENGNIHGANFHDVETFTGTVNGVPGTVSFDLVGSNGPDLVINATDTIVGASGGLAGLHGVLHEVGTVEVPTGPLGTYSGHID